MTTVSEAILSRRSIRAFLDKPVAPDLIKKIITQSARAPSGGNLTTLVCRYCNWR